MYNLTVATAHTFYVGSGQWLVHNAGCSVSFEARQLQKKFDKHALDFGVSGNYSKSNGAAFQSALETHVNDPTTQVIQGTYLNNPVTYYYNSTTGNVVIASPTGQFISGWKLSTQQTWHLLNSGKLGGH